MNGYDTSTHHENHIAKETMQWTNRSFAAERC